MTLKKPSVSDIDVPARLVRPDGSVIVVAPEVSKPVDGRDSSAFEASHSGASSLLKRKLMKDTISDDDARTSKAETNGASSFLSSRADFRTAAELWLAELPISASVLNKSFPQALRSIMLVDTFAVVDGPNSVCLSSSFKLSFNRFSIGAASFGRNILPTPATNLPLKSTVRDTTLAAVLTSDQSK